ncbi:MAG: hypothetical protein HQL40_04825 [Alphaproteobacteria bacterium]|nr:hypothetical protein [Alphaproteobacteria bacterium]
MAIVNLTQHVPTPSQFEAGVIDPPEEARRDLLALLDFTDPPTPAEIVRRADRIAAIAAASGCGQAMVGGAMFLMPALCNALRRRGIEPLCGFSRRRSQEHARPDGVVEKTILFEHEAFVAVPES